MPEIILPEKKKHPLFTHRDNQASLAETWVSLPSLRDRSQLRSANIWPKLTPPPPPPPCHLLSSFPFPHPPQVDVNQNVHLARYRTHTECIRIVRYIVLILILDKNENCCLLKNSTILKKYLNCQIIYQQL